MSDENTTPRQVSPEGPVPEDAITDRERTDDTLQIEQHPPTAELPPAPAPPVAGSATGQPAEPVVPVGGLVTVRTGPRSGPILLGLVCLLVSAYAMARQLTDWRLDVSTAGPVSIGALGALLLLVGLIGLVARRRS